MEDYPEYSSQLGQIVKEARKRNKLSQQELAKEIETVNRTVLNIENGRGNPKLEVLYPLVRTLGIDPRELFYPEMPNSKDSTNRFLLATLIESCSEEEAEALWPVVKSVLSALRSNRDKE